MLVNCNPKCKFNDGKTECKLDLKTNKAMCMECGVEIVGVSSFAKQSMKISKDIVDNKKRAFSFNCETCDEMVVACYKKSRLVGKDCKNNGNGCLINITKSMKNVIKNIGDQDKND